MDIKQVLNQNKLRLMISGSAALPQPMLKKWEDLTGFRLLERFGMTETLMALSNPYKPESMRFSGKVGAPLPGVEAALMCLKTGQDRIEILGEDSIEQGELLIASTSMFDRYLNRPETTQESFVIDKDGKKWFKTGDCAIRCP